MLGNDDLSQVDHFSNEYFAMVGFTLAIIEEEQNNMCNAVKKAISDLFGKSKR